MPKQMDQPAAELATSSRPEFTAEAVAERRMLVVSKHFMLAVPEPATPVPGDEADAQALRDALKEGRTPYDQVRRDLGLK